jgi:hypothetical protein
MSRSLSYAVDNVLALFAVLLVAVLCTVSYAATPRIIPLRTTATFSSKALASRWSAPVKSTDGRTLYVLSFVPPFFWVGGQIEGVDLALTGLHDDADAPNLLEPAGNWHGLQAYMFAADDLAKGAQNFTFGEKRTIASNKLGLIIRITVLNSKVTPISSGEIQLDSLDLKIEVDNLIP